MMSDVTGITGMKIIRAIVAGERSAAELAKHRDVRCKASAETIYAALIGNYLPEHVFALTQAIAPYDFYQLQVDRCDQQIESALKPLQAQAEPAAAALVGHDKVNKPEGELLQQRAHGEFLSQPESRAGS